MNAKTEALKNTFAAAAATQKEIKEQALAKVEQTQVADEQVAFKKTAKTAQTHEKYNEALANMSEKALAILNKYKVDAEALSKQSRELKKRSIAILEALAHSQRVNDRALDAVLQYIEFKKCDAMSLSQVQAQMNHITDTQAQYFKTCATFFKFATYSKSDKTLNLKRDANVLRDLLALYSTASASEE